MTMDIKWFEKSGKEGDVVISSRIRLARNLQKIPFPIRMNEQQKRQVRDNIVQAAKTKYKCYLTQFDLYRYGTSR